MRLPSFSVSKNPQIVKTDIRSCCTSHPFGNAIPASNLIIICSVFARVRAVLTYFVTRGSVRIGT